MAYYDHINKEDFLTRVVESELQNWVPQNQQNFNDIAKLFLDEAKKHSTKVILNKEGEFETKSLFPVEDMNRVFRNFIITFFDKENVHISPDSIEKHSDSYFLSLYLEDLLNHIPLPVFNTEREEDLGNAHKLKEAIPETISACINNLNFPNSPFNLQDKKELGKIAIAQLLYTIDQARKPNPVTIGWCGQIISNELPTITQKFADYLVGFNTKFTEIHDCVNANNDGSDFNAKGAGITPPANTDTLRNALNEINNIIPIEQRTPELKSLFEITNPYKGSKNPLLLNLFTQKTECSLMRDRLLAAKNSLIIPNEFSFNFIRVLKTYCLNKANAELNTRLNNFIDATLENYPALPEQNSFLKKYQKISELKRMTDRQLTPLKKQYITPQKRVERLMTKLQQLSSASSMQRIKFYREGINKLKNDYATILEHIQKEIRKESVNPLYRKEGDDVYELPTDFAHIYAIAYSELKKIPVDDYFPPSRSPRKFLARKNLLSMLEKELGLKKLHNHDIIYNEYMKSSTVEVESLSNRKQNIKQPENTDRNNAIQQVYPKHPMFTDNGVNRAVGVGSLKLIQKARNAGNRGIYPGEIYAEAAPVEAGNQIINDYWNHTHFNEYEKIKEEKEGNIIESENVEDQPKKISEYKKVAPNRFFLGTEQKESIGTRFLDASKSSQKLKSSQVENLNVLQQLRRTLRVLKIQAGRLIRQQPDYENFLNEAQAVLNGNFILKTNLSADKVNLRNTQFSALEGKFEVLLNNAEAPDEIKSFITNLGVLLKENRNLISKTYTVHFTKELVSDKKDNEVPYRSSNNFIM